jgi:lipopolysaccharide transport system ATP-binding protein
MSHRQIKNRLDEIIAFSEVEKFLDTPVKRYSSGMYVRLAFAVAAHLEPDILLVDEVLAVGDGTFQKKCLGKMESVGQSNRTVLFVSHNLAAIRSICKRTILLESGRIILDGPTEEVLSQYNKLLQAPRHLAEEGVNLRLLYSNGAVRVTNLEAGNKLSEGNWVFTQGQDAKISIDYEVREAIPNLGVYVALTSLQSGEIVTTLKKPVVLHPLKAGENGRMEIVFPAIPLRSGEYSLTVVLGDETGEKRFDYLDHRHNLPWLCIRSDEKDLLQLAGYFSIAAEVRNAFLPSPSLSNGVS